MTIYAYQDQDCDGEGIANESEGSDCRNEHSLKWFSFIYSNLAFFSENYLLLFCCTILYSITT
jgi:hypothetical protein